MTQAPEAAGERGRNVPWDDGKPKRSPCLDCARTIQVNGREVMLKDCDKSYCSDDCPDIESFRGQVQHEYEPKPLTAWEDTAKAASSRGGKINGKNQTQQAIERWQGWAEQFGFDNKKEFLGWLNEEFGSYQEMSDFLLRCGGIKVSNNNLGSHIKSVGIQHKHASRKYDNLVEEWKENPDVQALAKKYKTYAANIRVQLYARGVRFTERGTGASNTL